MGAAVQPQQMASWMDLRKEGELQSPQSLGLHLLGGEIMTCAWA